jgi:hypothetical protein
MKRNLIAIIAFLTIFGFGWNLAMAQFNLKIPKIKLENPEKEKLKDSDTTGNTKTKNTGSKLIYDNQRSTNVPLLMKNTIHVKLQMHDEYWKMKGQSNYSSWVPLIRFSQFYNNDKKLNYNVEYFNPDGSAWYSETLEQSSRIAADDTVLFQSPSPYGNDVLDTKSTASTGVYSFKITSQETKEILFQGKFKVGKFSRAYSPAEKNKNAFYVDYDWLLPFGTVGFHHSGLEIGGAPLYVNVWLKGMIEPSEMEGRIFYKGQQIASTKEGGAGSVEDREGEFAAAFNQPYLWRRWQFQWYNFLLDNNGSFNRENFPNAFYFDKNPGDYTVKIYRNGTQIRELSFTVGADGRIVQPGYTNEIPLPFHTLVLPTKVMGPEKWDSAGWKANSFYGNPLSGFAIQ